MTEDKMVGRCHQLDGDEFEQAPGGGEARGSLARCSPWGCKESDTTERLNNNILYICVCVSLQAFLSHPRAFLISIYLLLFLKRQKIFLSIQWLWLRLSMQGTQGSIPGRGAKIQYTSKPKNQNIRQKQYCNKLDKDFKNDPY